MNTLIYWRRTPDVLSWTVGTCVLVLVAAVVARFAGVQISPLTVYLVAFTGLSAFTSLQLVEECQENR